MPKETNIAARSRIEFSRRGFLGLVGVGAASLPLTGCGPREVSGFLGLVEAERRVPAGPETWVTSACAQCEGGCSIRVRVVGERAVGIVGNRFYPVNREGLCPKGLAGLQALYNPDRVRGPLKRAGERGQGRWEQITWQEAIQIVAKELQAIRERGESHTVAFLHGESRGLMDDLIARFCRAYGTPNDIQTGCPGVEAQASARYLTQGEQAPFAYDLENTSYLLSFGAPLLDAYVSPVRMLRAYGYLRQGRPGPRARIVQIEPRFSTTAAKADEWVPINPGTEGALALGIAYVLLREHLYNEAFVQAHTFGFDDWRDDDGNEHLGFRSLVLQEYNADEVARITGVPVATILRLAKEFGAHRPAIALGETGSTNAVYSLMAVHALNALVGSIDVPGGVVFPRPVPANGLPELKLDEAGRKGVAMPRLDLSFGRPHPLARSRPTWLPSALAGGNPYKASALFVYGANPAFSLPEPRRFLDALANVPFVVSFSPYIDETTMHADVVLPDHTYLERWQDVVPPPVGTYRVFGLRQPVVQPLHDTMHTGDVLVKIAGAIGGSVGQAFPWEDFLAALRERAAAVYEARRGSIVEDSAESWIGVLEKRGWWYPSYRTFDEFWEQLREKGGWWDPAYYFGEWDRIFRTRSGKFEFYSLTLKARIEQMAKEGGKDLTGLLRELGLPTRADRAFLPHFAKPRFAGGADEYPLHLHVMRLMALSEGRNANQPFLQEILSPHFHVRWASWLEINPETARHLGVADGGEVWVESAAGRVRTRARLHPAAMPGVVSLPANLGHTAYGRWSRGIGVNPMEIVAGEHDDLGGFAARAATRVKVYKA